MAAVTSIIAGIKIGVPVLKNLFGGQTAEQKFRVSERPKCERFMSREERDLLSAYFINDNEAFARWRGRRIPITTNQEEFRVQRPFLENPTGLAHLFYIQVNGSGDCRHNDLESKVRGLWEGQLKSELQTFLNRGPVKADGNNRQANEDLVLPPIFIKGRTVDQKPSGLSAVIQAGKTINTTIPFVLIVIGLIIAFFVRR